MRKLLSTNELYQENIISCKIKKEKRINKNLLGKETDITFVNKTKYLKICWVCGKPYESKKYNSYSCSIKCSHILGRIIKLGIKPPTNMKLHMKEKNVVNLKEMFGYR